MAEDALSLLRSPPGGEMYPELRLASAPLKGNWGVWTDGETIGFAFHSHERGLEVMRMTVTEAEALLFRLALKLGEAKGVLVSDPDASRSETEGAAPPSGAPA